MPDLTAQRRSRRFCASCSVAPVPLENMQNVTFIEGPLLKRFHLATLKFEAAGHSEGQAHDMQLVGLD